MKQILAITTLALGLSGTGVKAQSTPNPADQTGRETQARAAALMIPPNIQSQKDALLSLAQVQTKIEGVDISAGPVKTPHGVGGKISATVANADNSFALGAEIIKSPSFQSYFAALGFRVTADATGTVTISAVSESAQKALANDAYTGNLEAQSASVRLDHGSAFVRWLHDKGKPRELHRSVSSSIRVSQSEFDTFLRQTTTIEKNTKVTLWDAFSRNTVTVGNRFDVGDASVLTLQGGVTQDPYATRAVVGATLDTYHETWKSTIGAYSSSSVRSISAGISGKISNQLNWEARLSHTLASRSSSANTMAYVGIRYEFGGKPFARPPRNKTPDAKQAVEMAMNDQALRPQPSSLGRVVITETTETTQTSKDINKSPQPIKASSIQAVINDDATVSVAIANIRTGWMYEYQLDGGSWNTISGSSFRTGALSTGIHKIGVREKHPQSNEVGPITEVSPTLQTDTPTNTTTQSVTVTSTTATIPLSLSDKDGIEDYTCQVYSGSTPIGSPVSATGTSCTLSGLTPSTSYLFVEKALTAQKKPNGDIVWVVREVRTPFTTDAPPNTPPVANPDSISVVAGGSVSLNPVANDTDANGDALSISSVEQPASGGTVTKSGNTLVFTSNGTPGTYTFRYWVYDGQTNSLTPATVTVTVNAIAPVDQPGSASITGPATSSTGSMITIGLNATDADGIATWKVTSQRVSAATGQKGVVRDHVSGTGIPPATVTVLAGGSIGNTEEYMLEIVDVNGKTTKSQPFSTTITF